MSTGAGKGDAPRPTQVPPDGTDCGVWHPSTARRHLEWSEAA
jgi:hypothetical protein